MGQTADSVPVQSLPAGLVLAERAAYGPGASKEQYLRNNVAAQTLPSPITFASEEEPDNFVLLTPRRVTRPAPAARQPSLLASDQGNTPPTVKLLRTEDMKDRKMCSISSNQQSAPCKSESFKL